jgi:hypothetical protein
VLDELRLAVAADRLARRQRPAAGVLDRCIAIRPPRRGALPPRLLGGTSSARRPA